MNQPSDEVRVDRRDAMKWAAALALAPTGLDPKRVQRLLPAAGYGSDPLLNKVYEPGAFWPLTFDASQKRSVAALCDLIIPADERSPSASAVGVPAYIDEWISSPYPGQAPDRVLILGGLAWLDARARERSGEDFAALDEPAKRAICDPICHLPDAKPELQDAAQFFARFRDLCASAFYASREGMSDIGYLGNVPKIAFEGPPKEVLDRLGLG